MTKVVRQTGEKINLIKNIQFAVIPAIIFIIRKHQKQVAT